MQENDKILSDACILAEQFYWKSFFDNNDKINTVKVAHKQKEKIKKLVNNSAEYSDSTSIISLNHNRVKIKFKTILIAAILIALIVTAAFAVSPMRNFIIHIYDDCSEFIFNTDSTDDYLYASFEYIPKGFELISEKHSKLYQFSVYSNGTSEINIDTLKSKNSKTVIDTEKAICGEITVNDRIGYYSITDRSIILIWSTGKYNHCITADLNGDLISLDTLVKIAQSRKPVK